MRNIKIILVSLIIVILITAIVSAKPTIKKIDIDESSSVSDVPVTVVATSDSGTVKEVVAHNTEFVQEPNSEKWRKNLNIPFETEVTIESSDSSGETSRVKAYRGGCTASYDTHTDEYSFAHVEPVPISGNEVTFNLQTTVGPSGTAIIGFCVYTDNPKTSLSAGPDAETPEWTWVPKFNNRYRFGFGRLSGEDDNIPLDAVRNLNIGTAYYDQDTYSDKILMHILDPAECSNNEADDEDNNPNTCWRRPGTTQIPEFPTIALPIAAVIGLVFFFQQRKNKEE